MQWGIKAALEGDMTHTRNMVAHIKEQTDLVVSRLNALEGFRCIEPKGAFYIFPTIHCQGSDTDFVHNLLRETGVVTVPGAGFAERAGTKHIRIVTLPSKEILAKAMDLFEDFVNKKN
jgi:alanine-synthesizing transaminase